MNMLISMLIMTSVTFVCLMTPLSMALMLIIQTFVISMMTSMLISSFWYSYMLILIMISGLLIMFMYMASIASNEKFKISYKMNTLLIPFMIMLLLKNEELLFMKKVYKEEINTNQELIMTKLFNSKFIMPSITLIMFLFMMMVMISFLISTTEGPMRKSN